MKTVREVALLSGVSVRTLHYYDSIGLLRPAGTTESGYRLYGENELKKLQQILFFRELGFPLADIRKILEGPGFDPRQALREHRRLLMMERDRLDGLLRLVDRILKGEQSMSFQEFDSSEIEVARRRYAQEARERWGDTGAWCESEKKTASYGPKDWADIQSEMEEIFRAFAAEMKRPQESPVPPDDPAVQTLVLRWRDFITERFYDCTDDILSGLGEMYVADERFRKNIDRYGEGLADFISRAIRISCAKA